MSHGVTALTYLVKHHYENPIEILADLNDSTPLFRMETMYTEEFLEVLTDELEERDDQCAPHCQECLRLMDPSECGDEGVFQRICDDCSVL